MNKILSHVRLRDSLYEIRGGTVQCGIAQLRGRRCLVAPVFVSSLTLLRSSNSVVSEHVKGRRSLIRLHSTI